MYNPNDAAKTVQVDFVNLDLAGTVALRDVFAQKDLGRFTGQYEVTVPAHGTRIFVAQAQERLERTRYEAETAYISDYQELKNNQAEKTGIYEAATFCSAGFKAGWLGYSEQNDLQWRNVYSNEGGKYLLTIAYITGENRNINISVNGNKVQTISVNSGAWDKVATKTVNIELQKGCNVIRLSNASAWMPDIDYIDLQPVEAPSAIVPLQVQENKPVAQYDLQGRKVTSQSSSHNRSVIISNGRKVMN